MPYLEFNADLETIATKVADLQVDDVLEFFDCLTDALVERHGSTHSFVRKVHEDIGPLTTVLFGILYNRQIERNKPK